MEAGFKVSPTDMWVLGLITKGMDDDVGREAEDGHVKFGLSATSSRLKSSSGV